MIQTSPLNTLKYNPSKCINCDMCSMVCPHGVFAAGDPHAYLIHHNACMECGACMRNCPSGAIDVNSGVGCASALIYSAVTGKEACCGSPGEDGPVPCCC